MKDLNRWFKFSIWKEGEASKLDLSLYSDPGLQWTSTSFVQPQVKEQNNFCSMCFNQVMIHEKFLYDRKTGEWTPEKYLQDLQDRFLINKTDRARKCAPGMVV